MLSAFLVALYGLVVTLLAGYGLHSLWLLRLFLRHRERSTHLPARTESRPSVLVQVPVFNERDVVERVVAAAGNLDWPRGRLRLQLLDDGDDDSVELGASAIATLRAQGLDAAHLRREERIGFKAGALAHGLDVDARHPEGPAEFVAIFDADFVPPRDFLRRAIPDLVARADLAFVQARWEHLNAGDGLLTLAQAIGTDGHFSIEQGARAWSNLALNFNGSAGVWRRKAIEAAGGWQHDTLTEDLDLSYRAQLAGWSAAYRFDLAVPGELPRTIEAWRAQQFRWAKGSLQTARKLLPSVWRSEWTFSRKIAASAHLTHYLVHPLILASLVLAPLVARSLTGLPQVALAFGAVLLLAGMVAPLVLYGVGQAVLGRPRRRILALPVLAALGTGLAISNTRAAWEAFRGRSSPFLRTPKHGSGTGSYRAEPASGLPELLAALWGLFGLHVAWAGRSPWLEPILALYVLGFTHHGGRLFWGRIAERIPVEPRGSRDAWALFPLGAVSLAALAILAVRDASWREEPWLFSLAGLVLGSVYAGGLWVVRTRETGRAGVAWILVVGIALEILATGLWHSDDVNRYVVEGRQILAGQNPYAVPPADLAARALVPEGIARRVNHPEMTAIYPPLALASHAGVAALSPTPAAFTHAAWIATVAGLLLVLALLERESLYPAHILAAAWNPVLPLFAVGEAHNDVFMAVVLAAALLLLAHDRRRLSIVAATAACLLKPFAVAALPVVLSADRWRRWWLVPILAAAAFAPFVLAGPGIFESLVAFGGDMHFHGALEPLVREAARASLPETLVEPAVRAALAALLVAGLAWLWIRRGGAPAPTLTVRALAVVLLCSPTLHPWYFIALVFFLPFARTWALPLWTACAPVYWLHGVAIQSTGAWTETRWVTALAHWPAVLLMAWEAFGPAREPREAVRALLLERASS